MDFDEIFKNIVLEKEISNEPSVVEDTPSVETHVDDDPFSLEWVFGHNPTVKIVNITTKRDSQIVGFVASNICGLYNINTKECEYLLGHPHQINSISHDTTGRFLVTSDRTTINIWDRECEDCLCPELIRTIEIPEDSPVFIVRSAMSWDGKSIVTVDNQNNLKFWLWSYGNDIEDDNIELGSGCGTIYTIRFSPNPDEYTWFCVTTQTEIIFLNFHLAKFKLIVHLPSRGCPSRNYIDSAYIANDNKCITITSTGYGVFWTDNYVRGPSYVCTNNKQYLKSIRLEKSVALNTVKAVDGIIAIGMENGYIKFYDNDLKFLYIFESVKFDPIRIMAFNLVERKYILTMNEEEHLKKPILDDGTEVWYKPHIPVDATIAKAPFLVRDFIISTKTGKLELVNMVRGLSHPILYKSPSHITHFDLHPTKPWVCLGNMDSIVSLYDMQNKQIITEVALPSIKVVQDKKITYVRPAISCLSYSQSSHHLFCGLCDGSIWLLDPATLNPLIPQPLKFTYSKVDKIKFNHTGTYLAYSDFECYFNILFYQNLKWHIIGRYRQHSRRVIACLWLEVDDKEPRLVTIGEDKCLIEYNIPEICRNFYTSGEWYKSVPEDVCTEYVLEQDTVIISAIFIPTEHFVDLKTFGKHVLLISNAYHKYKIFDIDKFEILKTFAGPYFDSPLLEMKYLNLDPNFFIIFSTHKMIGIQAVPMTGNPFGNRGLLVGSNGIKTIRISFDNKYLFTLEEYVYSIKMWKINPLPVIDAMKIERPHLEPFVHLLPGGRDGWLFKEIQDYFFYIQLLCKDRCNTADDVTIGPTIPVTEVIDFMRGIGFFPSQFQLEALMNEITRILPGETPVTQVSFRDLVKLYVNHRPIDGYRLARIIRFLKILYRKHYLNDQENIDPESIEMDDIHFTKEQLMTLLIEKGDVMRENQALIVLKELLLPQIDEVDEADVDNGKNYEYIFSLLPNIIKYKNIITHLLGMPIDRENKPIFSKVADPSELEPKLTNKLKINLVDC